MSGKTAGQGSTETSCSPLCSPPPKRVSGMGPAPLTARYPVVLDQNWPDCRSSGSQAWSSEAVNNRAGVDPTAWLKCLGSVCSSQTAISETVHKDPPIILFGGYLGMPGSGAIQSRLCLTESCLQVANGCPTASQYSCNPPRVRSCIQHPKVMILLGIGKPGHDSALSMPIPKCFPACPDS